LDVIQYVLQQHPDALESTTDSGMLPLHLACVNNAYLDVVYFLLIQNPESVRSPYLEDHEGDGDGDRCFELLGAFGSMIRKILNKGRE
jgi:ankyrin repeat protein